MKILLTNDDGIRVDALRELAEALQPDHHIWVVAPDGNRSGKSMSITLHDHLRVQELEPRWYSCSGSPTDGVLLVSQKALAEWPDLIISGINYGPNLGSDILYSGTAAAAREGAFKGIPSIAVSLNQMQGPWDFKPAVEFIKNNLQYFVDLWAPDYFLNINFPSQLTENFELRRTYPCRRVYCDEYHRVDPPRGPIYFFPYGYLDCDNPQEGSDLEAVLQGHISISPIKVDPTAHDINEEIKRQMDNWEGSHEQRNRKETISGR